MTGILALAMLPLGHAAELSIPYERYELDNGLEVILSEDHDLPIVQVNIWYHVGSKDEVEGKSGFAHLFEHMMFQGTEHMDGEYFEPLQKIGASINGTTSYDRTNYYEGVPAEYLPLALWMEADRMGWLLPVLDEAKLTNQIDVVRNERRQRVDNQPYGKASMTRMETLFPAGHPYHITTIGKHEDLEAATVDDVHAFFKQWYVPNNATLVIAGDFDVQTAKGLVQEYYGAIPAGEEPTRLQPEQVTLTESVELRQVEEGVPHKRVWATWHTPQLYHEDDAALDILAQILSGGKGTRLDKPLVHERQIARSVGAWQASKELASVFTLSATAAADSDTDVVLAAMDEILADVIENGVTQEEVDVAITNYEARFISGLSTIAAKANQLNSYNHHAGEPDFLQEDLNRYLDITPEEVQAVARRWLDAERVVLHIWPPEAGAESTDDTENTDEEAGQ